MVFMTKAVQAMESVARWAGYGMDSEILWVYVTLARVFVIIIGFFSIMLQSKKELTWSNLSVYRRLEESSDSSSQFL